MVRPRFPSESATMTTIADQITPPGVITQEFRTPAAVRRGVIAGFVGNVLEWYDFVLFGFFAQQIGTHFFPADDPTASLLAAFGTFAAGFLMRPSCSWHSACFRGSRWAASTWPRRSSWWRVPRLAGEGGWGAGARSAPLREPCWARRPARSSMRPCRPRR